VSAQTPSAQPPSPQPSAHKTRFAPSPTGSLHVGGVRTALYCRLVADVTGGTFLLRIEDTDQIRSTDEAARGILRDLAWAGLSWDDGPYYQSRRLEIYADHARQLLDAGKAYEAWESGAELDVERKAAEADKQNFRYRRRPYTGAQLAQFRAEGRKPVVRFASPGHDVTVVDAVLGPVTVEADVLDDFVIVKADGFPTYHFAVVVDDHLMGVTMVLRGPEHLMNTHKHLLLYEAFGWTPPAHGHLPQVNNAAGAKMGKRDKAKAAREALKKQPDAEIPGVSKDDLAAFLARKNDSVPTANAIAKALGVELPMIEVQDFRMAGILPEALLNYLALLGWSPGDDREILSLDEMRASFSLDRVIKTAGKFDVDKLTWMNGEYIKSMSEDQLLVRLQQWLDVSPSPIAALDDARRRELLRMYRPRARTFVELERMGAFFFRAPTGWDGKQVEKALAKDGGWDRLRTLRDALALLPAWDRDAIAATVEDLVGTSGHGIGKFAQPIRIAVTGDGVSPEIFETLAFLGRDEVLARVERFLASATV
jgi:glutamyl/glutaminyl-tRNA synthetase